MKTTKLITSLAFLLTFWGCEKFPQYTGTYKLVGKPIYSASSVDLPLTYITQGKLPPTYLNISHQMKWSDSHWDHYLLMTSSELNTNKKEAKGGFKAGLDGMLRIENTCVAGQGECKYSGYDLIKKSNDNFVDQVNIGCSFYGYEHKISLIKDQTYPNPEMLKKIYWNKEHSENNQEEVNELLTDSVDGLSGDQGFVTIKDPSKAWIDVVQYEKWYNELVAKAGPIITIKIEKIRKSNYSHCPSGFPVSDIDKNLGSITMTYQLVPNTLNDATDIRSTIDDEDEIEEGSPNLFMEIGGW